MSPAMAKLIERARAEYDLVVIDTPPVTITADALGLGDLIDTSVLIVKWGRDAIASRHRRRSEAARRQRARWPALS